MELRSLILKRTCEWCKNGRDHRTALNGDSHSCGEVENNLRGRNDSIISFTVGYLTKSNTI